MSALTLSPWPALGALLAALWFPCDASAQPTPEEPAAPGSRADTPSPSPRAPSPSSAPQAADWEGLEPSFQEQPAKRSPPSPVARGTKEDVLQVPVGLALEFRVGSVLTAVGNEFVLPGTEGGMFVGYKADRLIVGLGFDLLRSVYKEEQFGSPVMNNSVTVIVFSPGMRLAIARTQDQRVEVYGQLDLGLGVYSFPDATANDPSEPPPEGSRFIWQVGPGLRYWLHPQFAVGVVSTLRGDSSSVTRGGITRASNIMGIVSAIQAVGVF